MMQYSKINSPLWLHLETNDRFDQIQGIINLYHPLGGGAE